MNNELTASNQHDHPMVDLLLKHFREFSMLKEIHQDLSTLDYNRRHSLFIDAPEQWPWLNAVATTLGEAQQANSNAVFVIIYPSTSLYRRITRSIGVPDRSVKYLSWHEIYVALKRADEDSRHISSIRKALSHADVTVFVGASQSAQEVVDHIKGYVEGCLILLG